MSTLHNKRTLIKALTFYLIVDICYCSLIFFVSTHEGALGTPQSLLSEHELLLMQRYPAYTTHIHMAQVMGN